MVGAGGCPHHTPPCTDVARDPEMDEAELRAHTGDFHPPHTSAMSLQSGSREAEEPANP